LREDLSSSVVAGDINRCRSEVTLSGEDRLGGTRRYMFVAHLQYSIERHVVSTVIFFSIFDSDVQVSNTKGKALLSFIANSAYANGTRHCVIKHVASFICIFIFCLIYFVYV
jgi:hypothetical protein